MSTKYEMWLSVNNEKQRLKIPVLPEKIEISTDSASESVDILNYGEISIKKGRSAYEFNFSSFFPAKSFQNVIVKTTPLSLANLIKKWQNDNRTVHFLCTGIGINCYCTIESFKYYEQGGAVGDIFYTLSLKEYRQVKASRITKAKNKSVRSFSEKDRVDDRVKLATYTVKEGDCLWSIAQAQLGDGNRYKEIYNLNKATIDGKNKGTGFPIYTIYTGQIFQLPE